MSHDLPDFCWVVLRQIFGDRLDEYEVSNEGSGQKGEGYVNEMIFLNMRKEDEDTHLVLKMMPHVDEKFIEGLYDTETFFYKHTWPALDGFQKSIPLNKYFDKIPRYFGSPSHGGRTVIVLENVKKSGFLLRDKKLFNDQNVIELVFKTYGAFHALSLAMKDKDPKEYDRLKNSLSNTTWHKSKDAAIFREYMLQMMRIATSKLEDANDEMKNKIEEFANRVLEEFAAVTLYKGNYDVITHGDCWINNFMFKPNKFGQPEDLRIIDFQFNQVATPVYDLSYFFYSGATKDLLDDLEHFLQVYHDSLSSKLREFDCNPDELYPYEVLKDEWKMYSRFGFIMGILMWSEKFKESPESLHKEPEHFDKEQYLRHTNALVHHVYRNGFI